MGLSTFPHGDYLVLGNRSAIICLGPATRFGGKSISGGGVGHLTWPTLRPRFGRMCDFGLGWHFMRGPCHALAALHRGGRGEKHRGTPVYEGPRDTT